MLKTSTMIYRLPNSPSLFFASICDLWLFWYWLIQDKRLNLMRTSPPSRQTFKRAWKNWKCSETSEAILLRTPILYLQLKIEPDHSENDRLQHVYFRRKLLRRHASLLGSNETGFGWYVCKFIFSISAMFPNFSGRLLVSQQQEEGLMEIP